MKKRTKKQEVEKVDKKSFSTSETILLVLMASVVCYFIGHINIPKKQTTVKYDPYVQEFVDNYNYIVDNYYEKVDRQDLIDKAISGMLTALDDPYSVYLNESDSGNFNITLEGSYEGIGLQITQDENTGYMLVSGVFEGTPSSKAGILVGDYIISVNDTYSKDIDPTEFSRIVREGSESKFTMRILRNGVELEVNLEREHVVLDSVVSEVYEREDKKIGYIYIGIFANNTYDQFLTAFNKLKEENVDSYIIDVRDNSGGHLTAVDSILDLFIDSKHVKYQFLQNGFTNKFKGSKKKVAKYDIVLLGNENSASAAEVLIASLRENLDVKLIGKKTYGKGTVQELVNLSDGNQYKITIKKWLTPKGNWINDTEGIEPDIEVELSDRYLETRDDLDDTQLQAAIDYLINR